MSGITAPPGTPGPGTSSFQQLPAGALEGWSGEGPLHFMARALQARLQQVFPPQQFDWHWLDGKMGKQQWSALTRRCPAVCLGFAGVTPHAENAVIFGGDSHWFLAVVTRNTGGPMLRMLGDKFSPGVLSLIRAATLAVHGYLINPPDTPWAASGTVRVSDILALSSEDWVDEALAAGALSLTIPYEELLPPGLDTPNNMDALSETWAFASAPATTQMTDLVEFAT
jgi:hypothetical protein